MGYRDYKPAAEKSPYALNKDQDFEEENESFLKSPTTKRASIPQRNARPIRIFFACFSSFLALCILVTLAQQHGAEVIKPLTSTYLTRLASAALPHVSSQTPPPGLTVSNFTTIDPSKILILQVDDRDLSKHLQLGSQATNFTEIPFFANSVLANVLYAQRWGYKYERLQAIVPDDVEYRHITWWKMPAIREALAKYEIVLFLDSDALMFNQDFSIQDLMVRWGMHDNIALCASTDYWVNWHINTGVMLFRRTEMAYEILDTLIACPEDPKSGCAEWRDKPFHEQTALNNQLRPAHPEWAKYLALAPCEESLGGPQAHCKGTIIRHEAGYTDSGVSYKDMVGSDVGNIFAQTMLGLLRARVASVSDSQGPTLIV